MQRLSADRERAKADDEREAAGRARQEADAQAQLARDAEAERRKAEVGTKEAERKTEAAEASAGEGRRQEQVAEAREREATASAERQEKIGASVRLALQGTRRFDDQLDLGLVLNAEALGVYDTYEARNGLLGALQQRPRLLSYLDVGLRDARTVLALPLRRTVRAVALDPPFPESTRRGRARTRTGRRQPFTRSRVSAARVPQDCRDREGERQRPTRQSGGYEGAEFRAGARPRSGLLQEGTAATRCPLN